LIVIVNIASACWIYCGAFIQANLLCSLRALFLLGGRNV